MAKISEKEIKLRKARKAVAEATPLSCAQSLLDNLRTNFALSVNLGLSVAELLNFIKDNKAADLENDAAMTASIEDAINEDRAAHNLEPIDFSSGLFNFRMFGENVGDTNMYKVSIFIPYSSGSVSEALLANNHLFASKKNRTAGNEPYWNYLQQ